MTYKQPTEPASVLGVLTDGFLLYRASIKSLYVPVFLVVLFAGEIAVDRHWGTGARHWISIVSWVVSIYLYGFIFAGLQFVASSDPMPIRSSLGIAMRRLPTLLAIYLLLALALVTCAMPLLFVLVLVWDMRELNTLVMMLPLIVPGVFLGTYLFASVILPITERYGAVESLRGSYFLVRRHWAKTFVVLAVMLAVVTGLNIANYQIAWLLVDQFDNDLVSMLTYAAFSACITPLGICLMYGVYQDLRLRQDD